jgi:restriction endonuclease S subunit
MRRTTLPTGWEWSSLGEVAHVTGGLTKGKKRNPGDRLRAVPYLRVANVQRGFLDLDEVKEIEATDTEISQLRLRRGDILLNEGGDRDKLGRGWVWNGEIEECLHQNHVFRARPALPEVNPHFLSHYANTFGQQFFLDAGAQTTNLASVSLTKIRGLPVPVPPAAEQRRIVAKIESLFARSSRAKEALSAIADLENRLVVAYTEPFPTTLLGDHIEEVDGVAGDRWRTFRAAGLSNEGIITERKEDIGLKSAPRCRVVYQGNIVFNPIRFSIGAIARYYGTEPVIVSPEYCVFRTKPTFSSELLRRFLRTPLGRSRLEIESQGSVRYRVYLANLAQLEIPTAPPARHAEAERFFTAINKVRAVADEATRDLKELESAILAKAFRGELVPQDPNDEPASALLERLRAGHRAEQAQHAEVGRATARQPDQMEGKGCRSRRSSR